MFMDNFKILFLGKDIVSQFKTAAAMDFQIPPVFGSIPDGLIMKNTLIKKCDFKRSNQQ